MGTVIGGLLMPQFKPYDLGGTLEQANRIAGGATTNQTALLQLADIKAKQQAEQEFLLSVQNDPRVREALFGPGGGGMGTIASLPTTAGAPPGPIAQSPMGGGPAQQIAAPPDLSQFATQGGPGQSTIASLGPAGQPQGPMQAPQNPALEMARTNPRAAMMMQQQLQGAQEQRWKNEQRRLDMGVKVAEGVAQELSVVKDQASLDAARERIRQYHPQAAAQIPQYYSKEALEPLIMKGVAVKDLALWRKNMAQARHTDMMTEQLPATFKALEGFATGGGAQAPTGETAPATTGPMASATGPVPGTENLSPAFRTKADSIADRLGANREDFYRVMHFETGGEMSPATRNRAGSGATGLIQFTRGTAQGLGTSTDALAKMTPEQQLDYVEKYLEPYKGKIGNLKDLYMAVLYPAAIGKSEDAVLFSPDKTPDAYRQNAGLDAGKKGYVTVGDAVAAVERTTGGVARPAGPGGTTGTAQAPPTNPKIAQLDARIKQGNAAAMQAEKSGMEGPARQVRAEVNDLVQERNRLDAPRQEFLKKQAVQGLELEQREREGLARAQLEADTKPASNTEIDAINRALPRDKQLSYGTTYKEIREKKLVGAGPVSEKVVTDLTTTTRAIQDFEALNNAVAQLPTGPLTQYVETFKERWGIDISDEKVAQRAILAGATNQLLKARSGGAITEGEHTRLLNELPNEANDPKVFKARMANTLRQFKNDYKTKVQILRKTGHAIPDDLMEPLSAPEAAPVAKPSTAVDRARDAMRR